MPIGIARSARRQRTLHLPHTRRDHRIDWPGALALVVGLVPLLIIAEQGREWGWTSASADHLLRHRPASASSRFVLAERAYGDDALLPLRLFRGRTFGVGSVLNFVVGMGMFGGLAAAAALPADRQGLSPTGPVCCCCR